MTHRERIEAAIKGEKTDRTPIALWRHFPHVDQTALGLATAVVDFQKKFDFDLVKVTPTSGYPSEAWGDTQVHLDDDEGTREHITRVVTSPGDWRGLQPLTFDDGVLNRELEALRLIRRGVGPDIHVFQTIFSPLTIAKQMAGDLLWDCMIDHADDLSAGLETVAETTARYTAACLENGADGIYFATQLATRLMTTDDQYARFGVPYDMQVLEAVSGTGAPVILHLHGVEPMFALTRFYPVNILNWHDRETSPTLDQGQRAFTKGAVLGGLGREGAIFNGTEEQIRAEVEDAVSQTGGLRMIVGTGCVAMATTPEENIAIARAAVEK